MNTLPRPALLRWTVTLAVGLLLVALAACSSSTPTPTPTRAPTTPAATPTQQPGTTATPTQAAWEAEWERVVAAAKREGRLKMAGQPGDARRAGLVDCFQAKYPEIQVDYIGMSPADAQVRLKAEYEGGVFDYDVLAQGIRYAVPVLAPDGALREIDPLIILPNIINDEVWHGGWRNQFGDVERKYIVRPHIAIAEIAYVDTSVYPLETFTDVRDLMKPEYKGKIVIADPRLSSTPELMLAFIHYWVGPDAVRYILTEQNPLIVGTQREALEAMIRQGKPIGIGLFSNDVRAFQREGLGESIARIDFPNGRQVVYSAIAALPKAGKNPNAAQVYLNFFLSQEGQTCWAEKSGENSTRLDVPIGDPLRYPDPQYEWLDFNWPELDFANKHQIPTRQIVAEVLGSR